MGAHHLDKHFSSRLTLFDYEGNSGKPLGPPLNKEVWISGVRGCPLRGLQPWAPGVTWTLLGNFPSPSKNRVPDVTGDLTGDVMGNLTGDVTGDVTGDASGWGGGWVDLGWALCPWQKRVVH